MYFHLVLNRKLLGYNYGVCQIVCELKVHVILYEICALLECYMRRRERLEDKKNTDKKRKKIVF